jgi:hypothetical protein
VGKKRPAKYIIDEDDIDGTPLDNYFSWHMIYCFKCLTDKENYLNLPDNIVDNNPLDIENIKEQQDTHDALL